MFAACLSALFVLAAQDPALASSPTDEPVAVTVRQTSLTRDSRGRPTIDARFNDQASVRMVVDTAAQTSLITLPLAREFQLPALGESMSVSGVAGQSQAELYGVDRFSTDLFDMESVALLALPNAGVTEARGIVGMETLSQGRLVFDMTAHSLSLGASGEGPEGFVGVQGRLDGSGLLTVPVEIDGVIFDALVDTGAAVSVASGGALRALGWAEDDPRLKAAGTIRGASLHQTAIRSGKVGRIKLGPVGFRDVELMFNDAPTDQDSATDEAPHRPSLILGSDLLNNLDAFALDFPRAEFQIRIPPQARRPG
jgi:predicted aspartyl protease